MIDIGDGIRLGAVTDPFGDTLGVIANPHFRPEVPPALVEGPIPVVDRGARLAAGPGDESGRRIAGGGT